MTVKEKYPYNFSLRIRGNEFLAENQLKRIIKEAVEDTALGVQDVTFPSPETGFGNNKNLHYWAVAEQYQNNLSIARTCGTCRHSFFNGNPDGCPYTTCRQN